MFWINSLFLFSSFLVWRELKEIGLLLGFYVMFLMLSRSFCGVGIVFSWMLWLIVWKVVFFILLFVLKIIFFVMLWSVMLWMFILFFLKWMCWSIILLLIVFDDELNIGRVIRWLVVSLVLIILMLEIWYGLFFRRLSGEVMWIVLICELFMLLIWILSKFNCGCGRSVRFMWLIFIGVWRKCVVVVFMVGLKLL